MPRPRLTTFWLLQLLGWSGFYCAMAFSRVGRYPLPYMLTVMGLLTLLGMLASLALRAMLRGWMADGVAMPRLVVGCVVAGYLLAALWTGTFSLVILATDPRSWFGRESLGSLVKLFDGTVYHAFALVAWGSLYIGSKQWLSLQEARERAIRAEALATEARLRTLEAQLNPHFLFNALNAISTLVVEQRTAQATAMIARLSDLLRTTLQHRDRHEVTLAEELSVVDRYLEIETIRFGDRLQVLHDVASDAGTAMVPRLLLQPLVENAVRHGIARSLAGGMITIGAARRAARLELWVVNSGGVADGPPTAGAAVGLTNVKERLAALHGDHADLVTEWNADREFVVRITMPFTEERSAPSPP